jgi:hypothetical protein
MLEKAFEYASIGISNHPNLVPELSRKLWLETVQATKEALSELHTSNEVEFISLN